jgi:(2Fe-2S) ferredoxin
MPKPEKHVFICTQSRPPGHPRGSCAEKGCGEMAETFWFEMQERDLFGRFAVTSTGCIGPCGVGPNVLIYPEGVMYSGVTKADVPTIIEQHLLNDTPVESLLAPADMWG